MRKSAGTIIRYISASNFPIFFAKVHTCVLSLAATSEESPDMWDVEILQFADFNSKRLSEFLQELTNHCRQYDFHFCPFFDTFFTHF